MGDESRKAVNHRRRREAVRSVTARSFVEVFAQAECGLPRCRGPQLTRENAARSGSPVFLGGSANNDGSLSLIAQCYAGIRRSLVSRSTRHRRGGILTQGDDYWSPRRGGPMGTQPPRRLAPGRTRVNGTAGEWVCTVGSSPLLTSREVLCCPGAGRNIADRRPRVEECGKSIPRVAVLRLDDTNEGKRPRVFTTRPKSIGSFNAAELTHTVLRRVRGASRRRPRRPRIPGRR
jgi:hypothetical protein